MRSPSYFLRLITTLWSVRVHAHTLPSHAVLPPSRRSFSLCFDLTTSLSSLMSCSYHLWCSNKVSLLRNNVDRARDFYPLLRTRSRRLGVVALRRACYPRKADLSLSLVSSFFSPDRLFSATLSPRKIWRTSSSRISLVFLDCERGDSEFRVLYAVHDKLFPLAKLMRHANALNTGCRFWNAREFQFNLANCEIAQRKV